MIKIGLVFFAESLCRGWFVTKTFRERESERVPPEVFRCDIKSPEEFRSPCNVIRDIEQRDSFRVPSLLSKLSSWNYHRKGLLERESRQRRANIRMNNW